MKFFLDFIPHVAPYEIPSYFIVLAILLIPSAILSLNGKRSMIYQNFLTLYFLWISFAGTNIKQGIALIIYIIWQCVLTKIYFIYRQRDNKSIWFYMAVIMSLMPMFIMKIGPLTNSDLFLIVFFLGYSYLTFRSVQVIMEIRDGIIVGRCHA